MTRRRRLLAAVLRLAGDRLRGRFEDVAQTALGLACGGAVARRGTLTAASPDEAPR